MKGLVLKDFYNLKPSFLILGIALIFLGIMSVDKGENFAGAISVVLVMLPLIIATNTFGLDEKVKWESYAMTMPITRKDIIKGRYITLIISVIIITIFIAIVNIFIQILGGTMNFSEIIETVLLCLSVGIVFSAIMLAIVCKFGLEKMRIVLMFFIVIPALIGTYIQEFIGKANTLFNFGILLNYAIYILPIIAIFICFISYIISVKIYEKKEF